ncbi:MAG: KH domain-containing protein [Cyanothece sp. SIO2G6]|nr:KH domain-containing protein [Cyanothece sp. SIO2G6]
MQCADTDVGVNYVELVRFLVEPFLESPNSLRVSCEMAHKNQRVLIRLAVEGEDKGRIFGRGGRNIQAVRTVLQAVGQSSQQKVHLEVFGGEAERRNGGGAADGKAKPQRAAPKRPSRRPSPSQS